ncbi:MAG: GDYXXLXY domain-containing protein [Polyangiales bacterium]
MTRTKHPLGKATVIAVAVQLAIIAIIPVQPLWVRATGTTVYLETEKMDPRALFRGHYAILGYRVAQNIVPGEMARASKETGKPVYVTVTTEHPGRFVAVSLQRPEPEQGRACIVGRIRRFGSRDGTSLESSVQSVDFPQIAQYFASEEEARRLEGALGDNLLGKVATSRGCNAQLVGLEPPTSASP